VTRLVALLFSIMLLTSCTSGGNGYGNGSGEPDAAAFKTKMDAEAQTLLPDLMSSLGGNLNGMQATFYERGGFGLWDYTASGGVGGTDAPTTTSFTASAGMLEDHHYTVETDEARREIRGTKGDISVIIQASLLTGESVGLNIRMSNHGAISDGDDFAENAPAEDYLAYLK